MTPEGPPMRGRPVFDPRGFHRTGWGPGAGEGGSGGDADARAPLLENR